MMRWNSVTGIFIICSDSTLARFFLSSSKVGPMYSPILEVLMLQVDNCKSSLLPVFTKIKKKNIKIHLIVVFGCFGATMTELNSCNRYSMVHTAKNVCYFDHSQKSFGHLCCVLGEYILDEYMQSLFLLLTVKSFNWHKGISSSSP